MSYQDYEYQAIVFADMFSFTATKKTVMSLLQQTHLPSHITIINPYRGRIKPSTLVDFIKTLQIPWRVENLVNPEVSHEAAIDMTIDIVTYPYYSVFWSNFIVPKDTFQQFFTEADKIFQHNISIKDENDKKDPILYCLPNATQNGLVVNYVLHKIYSGNSENTLYSKIKKHVPIHKITDICPNFPSE